VKYEQRVKNLRRTGAGSDEMWRAWVALRELLEAAICRPEGADALHRAEAIAAFERRLATERGEHSALITGLSEDLARGTSSSTTFRSAAWRCACCREHGVRHVPACHARSCPLLQEGCGSSSWRAGRPSSTRRCSRRSTTRSSTSCETPSTTGSSLAEVRAELGKPETGTITVSARPEGDHIVIEVSDDGAGIDPDKVREAAVRKGYITQAEADSMSDREALFLIFEKGFSTSTIITEISGRGVGMDVVREYIVEMLKGDIDVFSTKGKGTTFRLTIPLTLAIIRALMVRVGDRTYALPTTAIEETLLAEPAEIIKVEGREALSTRPAAHDIRSCVLADILGVTGGRARRNGSRSSRGFSGHRFGFIVDELVGEQQIVIKTLGNHLRKVENIAGVTILGAGEIVPILNVPDLMANARAAPQKRCG
jgi:hypothetical protein